MQFSSEYIHRVQRDPLSFPAFVYGSIVVGFGALASRRWPVHELASATWQLAWYHDGGNELIVPKRPGSGNVRHARMLTPHTTIES